MNGAAATPQRIRIAVRGLWLFAFVAILLGIRLALINAYGNATPFWDQWTAESNRLYKPLLEGRLDWMGLFEPHVVHRILTLRLLALGTFAANGIWNPLLQMVVNSVVWACTLALLVALLDRATGRRHLPLLLAFALVVFGLPYGNENLLAGFQGCFPLVVLWGTLALWALVLAAPFGLGWWWGILAAILGYLSLGSGVFVAAAAAAVAAAQYATGVRRGRRQLAAIGLLAALFGAGVLLTHGQESTAELAARSVAEGVAAWTRAAGWPLRIRLLGPLVTHWPALVLATVMLRRPPAGDDPRWFLLAAVACTLGQAAAIAYGRAAANCLTSRYLDLYAVGLMVEFACMLAVFPDCTARGRGRAVAAAIAWVVVVLGSLAAYTQRHARPEMEFRRDTAAAQQAHTRAYVLTGDIGHLEDKPWLHVPFPWPDRLALALDDPMVRSFLPAVVAPPLPATEFASEPAGVFVPDGADPAVAGRDEPVWGSHGSAGPEGTGSATIAFGGSHRGYAVTLPVAVGGDVAGLSIEVEQDGERRPVPVPTATGTWSPVRVKVRGRPFTVHVADRSAEGWIAVAAPVVEGRFDRRTRRWLDRWDRFVVAGIVLAMALLVHRGLDGDA